MKSPDLYETLRFIVMFKTASHQPYPKQDEFDATLFPNINFRVILNLRLRHPIDFFQQRDNAYCL
jgi:hypothetical protein